jgi:hypothetical protein
MSCHDFGKTSWNWCLAGERARSRSLPRYDDKPATPAKIVSARPDTIWLARNVITRNAWIAASAAPASAATPIAPSNATLVVAWKRWTAQKPITAPTSIIPSTPRFSTPDRSASNSPSAP